MMLYQLSYEATHWERGQCIEFIFTAMIILHCHLHLQFKYELFQVYFTLIIITAVGLKHLAIVHRHELVRGVIRAGNEWGFDSYYIHHFGNLSIVSNKFEMTPFWHPILFW